MNLLYVNYLTFASNSAVHLFHIANRMVERGEDAAVCVTRNPGSLDTFSRPAAFRPVTYREARRGHIRFADGRGPDLVHAWTPRERVRKLTLELGDRWACPYLVHLEDNEDEILERSTGRTAAEYEALSPLRRWLLSRDGLAHPSRARSFLESAAGITLLIDTLREFVPPGVPTLEFWPAYDDDLISPGDTDRELRRAAGIEDTDLLVYYPGNLTAVNRQDLEGLYRGVELANRRGIPARLVRTGMVDAIRPVKTWKLTPHWFRDLGQQPRDRVARWYRAADVLVQPGRADAYNRYRFPSKLPEFFGAGRPVLLPRANVGLQVTDGINGLLLESGAAEEIAGHLATLHADPGLRARLGVGAADFAREHFSWDRTADRLWAFYQEHAAG